MVELDPETGKAVPGAAVHHLATRPDAPYAVEGASILHHGRYYYCSASVTGPYTDSEGRSMLDGGGDLLLASHGRYVGPGGESTSRAHGKTWLAYHYYDANDDGTPKLGLDELRWRAGWPVFK
ncbi:hypothetical protein [Streptomyces sp. NPDC088760]|uniref:hypothetical protein n=1 Tax=Streptomyces sp. NPDC088760 TaxID=3365890 RepID=UPI00382B4CAE